MRTENEQSAIIDRLMQIVTATSATVETKNGPVEDEATADKDSLTAAKSLFGAHIEFLKRGGDRERGRGGARNAYECISPSANHQNAILDRLMQIVSKQTVTKWTKNGPIADEVAADKNSIAAAKFLISLQAKYQKYGTEGADIVMLNVRDQKVIVERMMQILNKTSVIRQTRYGPFEDEATADQNAIRAARVLISYDALGAALREGEIGRGGEGSGTAGSCASHDGLRIGRLLARCLREGAGTAGSCASHASESRRAGDGFKIGESFARCQPENPGSARLSALDTSKSRRAGDELRLNDDGQSYSAFEKEIPSPGAARESSGLKVENRPDAAREEIPAPQLPARRDEDASPDHRSGGAEAEAGARGQSGIAGCEPDLAPSGLGFTAEDVVREALKIVARDTPDFCDKIDKNALIERVRAKLDRARSTCASA